MMRRSSHENNAKSPFFLTRKQAQRFRSDCLLAWKGRWDGLRLPHRIVTPHTLILISERDVRSILQERHQQAEVVFVGLCGPKQKDGWEAMLASEISP